MQELQIVSVIPCGRGKSSIRFENGMEVFLYRGEMKRLCLREGDFVSGELYEKILHEIIGTRAKKRALFLLERMERTERQLREKLRQNGYPEVCIEEALTYVKEYHYVDDYRYAGAYIRCHQGKKSRQRLRADLLAKGIGRDTVERAIEEEFCSDEREQIRSLLEKRDYVKKSADPRERQKIYRFLLGRGFQSSDILHTMRILDESEE